MSVNEKKVVQWFLDRIGKLTYSMSGSRNGTDGTADCSGSITQAIKDAGGNPYAYLYSTVTLGKYLKGNGYKRISVNQEWDAKEGDIVQMSWGKDMSTSGGAGGHVGVMKNAWDFISVDYWTGGQKGTAVSEHNIDNYLNVNQPRYFEVWRIEKDKPSPSNPKPTPVPPNPTPQSDVDYMKQYGIVKWNSKQFNVDDRGHVNGMYQVISNELGGLQQTPSTSATEWTNNGVPMSAVSWTDGTSQDSINGTRFKFNQDVMTIVDYDQASNGIAVNIDGYPVWVDATVARKA